MPEKPIAVTEMQCVCDVCMCVLYTVHAVVGRCPHCSGCLQRLDDRLQRTGQHAGRLMPLSVSLSVCHIMMLDHLTLG